MAVERIGSFIKHLNPGSSLNTVYVLRSVTVVAMAGTMK